ncbi:MAG TPA: response regulator [Chloroflexota bacterium]|jgi:CheY-like chemotaxis protein|nr:response regulator [Chloroflexota bacterium]
MNGKRVLVVDDDTGVCSVIQAALEDEGFTVQAATGPGAVTLARSDPPDLILLDLMMPALDGREIRQRLLADPRTAKVPCVLMTAEDEIIRTAHELHTQGYLPKPFDLDDLIDLVRRETHDV